MTKFKPKLTRKSAVFIIIAAAALLAVIVLICSGGGLDTPEERAEYLASLGWEVNDQPIETLSVTLGETLEEPYLSYNDLQRSQGFDLTRYCGQTLSRYTYVVTNYPDASLPCQADLYVCGGVLAAGDIVCTGENGFMAGLAFPAN